MAIVPTVSSVHQSPLKVDPATDKLISQGAVAWFSVSATRQQLEQNRRCQAGRVSFWYVLPKDGYGVVVVNRSLDR
ncbi:hypothetical protein [Streptomyces sp. NPDC058678]|uniref:hypothetical protein n=1 Tax=Streptomyces sp. NPDC058678 TaxID=3346595 RepID=UPI00364F768B